MAIPRFSRLLGLLVPGTLLAVGLTGEAQHSRTRQRTVPCAPDNAGLRLPPGFCAQLVAESLGRPRHLAVAPNGDVFAARRNGGVRLLGIPTVNDRLIQQASAQVLGPIFAPEFSTSSFGFRPGRSAHQAVKQIQSYIKRGYKIAVDLDPAKFFDRVNHDVMMERLSRRIADGRVLGLIRRYLTAGVLADGVVVERHEGTPQGGPLSPLLANVLLDEVDKALESRGLKFARYADDLNVYAGSKRAADDAMATLKRLFARLRLQVNDAKSAVARVWERGFLGYSFWVAKGRVVRPRVAPAALAEMKARVRVITSRTGGRSMTAVVEELRSYLTGWKLYFQLAGTPRVFSDLDEWLRRRLRSLANKHAGSARCWWRSACNGSTHAALPNSHFDQLGVPRLAGR